MYFLARAMCHSLTPNYSKHPATSVSDPDPVGSAFNLGLDPGSGSVFEFRIRIPDPDVLK
jgi:hypothetical protein